MIENPDLSFDEDNDNFFKKHIQAKNFHLSNNIEILYEFLNDILSDNGIPFKSWIGETNFRKYIFEIYPEIEIYKSKLDIYIEENNFEDDKIITLKILKIQTEEKIEVFYNYYKEFIRKIDAPKIFSFQNNFDSIKEDRVYKYFFESLVDKKYLDEVTLKKYLKIAFEEKKYPKNLLSFNDNSKSYSKGNIVKIFAHYYSNIAYNTHGKKEGYVNLLTKYFSGFNSKSLSTNFTKDL